MKTHRTCWSVALGLILGLTSSSVAADQLKVHEVEGQPLAANANRLVQAMQFLGTPFSEKTADALKTAIKARDAEKIQKILDPFALVQVSINPESRVKVARGPAKAQLQQNGWTPVLVKVVNEAGVKSMLRIMSPQAGAIFSGGRAGNLRADKDRFLDVEIYRGRPLTRNLSGLQVEYAVALIYSSEKGKREATLSFNVGQGTQDLGFRGETPILFVIRPAVAVKLSVRDFNGKSTTGRFTFRDKAGRVYPSRAKRLAPDFFFQDQIYRHDGGTVLLPPGQFTMIYSRGPEYRQKTRQVTIPEKDKAEIAVKLERWINPMDYGFYNGDHHIHAAGCAHYTNPTEGVFAEDMFLHVKGEGLNVGCNLTWGPCYDFQRQFFDPKAHKLSEPLTVLKYDVEVSGFGSQRLGHVCLLNLRDQTYPGSEGTSTKGWPTWTTPLMRWAKAQGAVTGYAHSANGLVIRDPQGNARRLIRDNDANKDGKLSQAEGKTALLPEAFATIDRNKDGSLTARELTMSVNRQRNALPNVVIPPMNGIGAQEICVTVSQKLCDFISAMDTQRVPEWNCWYHIMNCGFRLKVSGETDFPCISGSRVGEGRVYVQMGKIDKIDFTSWCEGLAKGRSYVSDGYAHALKFAVNDKNPGDQVTLKEPGQVTVNAKVAFASELPLGTAKGGRVPPGKTRKVELIVNGKVAASKVVPADDKEHDLSFEVKIDRSSWVALRQFPQLHTNPVNVIVGGKPIRASRQSAQWCLETIKQLWRVREMDIAAHERGQAEKTFQRAMASYRRIASECPAGS